MKVYLNDEKRSVDPRLHLKRVGLTVRNHCASLYVDARNLDDLDFRINEGSCSKNLIYEALEDSMKP